VNTTPVRASVHLLVESYEEEQGEVGVVVATGGQVLLYRESGGDSEWTDLIDQWRSSAFIDQCR
jgi:hypothetical protein